MANGLAPAVRSILDADCETSSMSSYQASSKLNRIETDVLVVHCSDHRFQAGLYEFLNLSLNLNENYDLLVIPGGPQFLVERHELKRLIMIAHEDCGWYRELPFHLHASSEPRQRQEEDLRRVKRALARDFPELHVELYYAGWDANDRVTVEPISA
jgi:hypothetical protein